MIKYSFILLLFLFSLSYAQEGLNLDSLYSRYIEYKSGKKTEAPGIETIGDHMKCGFELLSLVHHNFLRFSQSQQTILKIYDVRPTLTNELISPYGHFKIHYDLTGINKPAYDASKTVQQNIALIAAILDSVYHVEIDILGYPPPPADFNNGGDNLYDIYIENLSAYGGTQPEINISDNLYTSYMSIDNDYSNYYSKGIAGAKVTVAHEFFHAIQIGNYSLRYTSSNDYEDLFFFEISSTAMEEFVFDDVNDYYAYQRGYFNYPDKNFQAYQGYELAAWNIFLSDRFGYDIIKRQWELFRNERAFSAINASLAELGSSFKRELNLFGIWTYYTDYRKKIAEDNASADSSFGYFEEGEMYPLVRINPMTFSAGIFPVDISTMPMSNNFIKIINNGSTPYADTIVTIITNGNLSGAINTPNSFFNVQYSLFDEESQGRKHMVNNYFYNISSSEPDTYSDANIFNNRVVNGGEFLIVESEYAYPMPFNYRSSYNQRIYIPVAYNRDGEARLYVYTSAMNLVYEGIGKIITPNDKFVVEWNGRDSDNNELATGIYLFVTESDDSIKKGKIVIFSE